MFDFTYSNIVEETKLNIGTNNHTGRDIEEKASLLAKKFKIESIKHSPYDMEFNINYVSDDLAVVVVDVYMNGDDDEENKDAYVEFILGLNKWLSKNIRRHEIWLNIK